MLVCLALRTLSGEPNINPQIENGRIGARESDCTQEGEKDPKAFLLQPDHHVMKRTISLTHA